MKKKVLMVSWSWFPSGGDWTYIENLKKLYESKGFEVVPFSTINERNFESDYSQYFVEQVAFKNLNGQKNLGNAIKAVKSSVVSSAALKNLDLLLKEHEIAFAHFHNIHHHLTPAIIWKLKKKNIKIFWSLHDYKIICPENSFVSNGKICEKCLGGHFINCALNKCKLGSFPASLLTSFEAYFYSSLHIYDRVDQFLCPSQFLYKKFVEAGFSAKQLSVSNYCYDTTAIDDFIGKSDQIAGQSMVQPFILYVGRIELIKGIQTLIDAVNGTKILLKIAGTGTALETMKKYVIDNKLSNIEFLGFCNKEKIYELTYRSAFVVCPSEWYENFPFAIIESLLFNKPVIGSNIGGIPELVVDGKTGFLYEPGNVAELRKKIQSLWMDPDLITQIGKQAREHVKHLISFDTHWAYLNNLLQLQNI